MRWPSGSLTSRMLKRLSDSTTALERRLSTAARVINYARGSLEFEARPDDTFIVTYPRSGTTLMQFLMHQLLGDGDVSFDHISQVVPWFERSLAVGMLTAGDLAAMPRPRLFKSHLARCWVPGGCRYIYITRDGRDVAVSYYHFYRSHLRFEGSFEQFFQRFLRGEVQYGSWFKHTAGWHAHRGDPSILFLRFEDLVGSLPDCLESVIRFCRLSVTPERRSRILDRCSFDFMKRHEAKFDFTTEHLLERGYRLQAFLREGKTGVGIETLTPGQEAAFRRHHEKRPRFAGLELDLPRFLH